MKRILCALCAVLLLAAPSPVKHPPRGLLTLALLNKNFPVHEAARVINASPSPAFGFLYRSFGADWQNLRALLKRVVGDEHATGRTCTVVVYADCGPCRSPRRPKGLWRLISGNDTSHALDTRVKNGNKAVLRRFKRAFLEIRNHLPRKSGVKYVFIPGLEDTYSNHTYSVMKSLAKRVFISRPDVNLARNPLNVRIAVNGKKEAHGYELSLVRDLERGDIVTGDGDVLCFSGEKCRGFSFSQVRDWLRTARTMGITALLYRPDTQGLPLTGPISLIPPEDRKYRISHADDLIKLLGD